MIITSVANPRWADEAQTVIDCDITTNITGSEIMPFTASPNDPEPLGREIFEKCVRGEYGTVKAYELLIL